MADDVIEWPLRAVSKDPTNVTKLDAEHNVLTSTTDIAATFVQKAGDTMTGPLIVQPDVMTGAQMIVRLEAARPTVVVEGAGDDGSAPNFIIRRARGTLTAPTPVRTGDELGTLRFNVIGYDSGDKDDINNRAIVQVTALSDATDTVPPDTSINLLAVSSDSTRFVEVRCEARDSGTAVIIASDTFKVTAAGDITAAGWVTAVGKGNGIGGQFTRTDVDAGQLAYGVLGKVIGISPTTGAVIGVRGETAGTYDLGVGVMGVATGTGDENIGLQAIASGAATNIGLYIGSDVARSSGSYAISSQSSADTFLKGSLGLNFVTPTHQLEVGGTTMLRGTCEITGNITASGTAHSFAAGSIGSPVVIGNTPRTIAATGSAGSAGQMVWDDDNLFLRTTSGWKKVPLTAL